MQVGYSKVFRGSVSHPLVVVDLSRRRLGLLQRLLRGPVAGVLLVLQQQLHGVLQLVVQGLQRLPGER